MSGCSPAWDVLAGAPGVASGAVSSVGLFSNSTASPGLALVGLGLSPLIQVPLQLVRRALFIAVNHGQFICCRLSRFGNEPTRLLFCALGVSQDDQPGERDAAVEIRPLQRSGAGDRDLRLNVYRHWRKDLDEVLAALQAGGAAVEGASRAEPQAARTGTLPYGQPSQLAQ